MRKQPQRANLAFSKRSPGAVATTFGFSSSFPVIASVPSFSVHLVERETKGSRHTSKNARSVSLWTKGTTYSETFGRNSSEPRGFVWALTSFTRRFFTVVLYPDCPVRKNRIKMGGGCTQTWSSLEKWHFLIFETFEVYSVRLWIWAGQTPSSLFFYGTWREELFATSFQLIQLFYAILVKT